MAGRRKFAKVQVGTMPPNVGKFMVVSAGARWGVHDTEAAAQEQADRLNDVTALP